MKASPRPIRFDSDDDDAITTISENTGIDRSQIVRAAVKFFLHEIRRTGSMPVHGMQDKQITVAIPPAKPVKYKLHRKNPDPLKP